MRTTPNEFFHLAQKKAEFIEPMECALVSKLPERSEWTYEVKLDGYRAIGVKSSRETILYSRNHKGGKRLCSWVSGVSEDDTDDESIYRASNDGCAAEGR